MDKKRPKDLIWVEEVRAKMLLPGRAKPIARSAFRNHLLKHGIAALEARFDGPNRAYVTLAQEQEILKSFRLLHWRLFQKGVDQ
jgi:hypothetical protein